MYQVRGDRHHHIDATNFYHELGESEDLSSHGSVRTGKRHSLITAASELDDALMWSSLGRALVRAVDVDDLTPDVSDRFVELCPDQIFLELVRECGAERVHFFRWRDRARALLDEDE